jgi:hypothetical protein
MSEYPGYKNHATFVASEELTDYIYQLRSDYPEVTVLDVKSECLKYLLKLSNNETTVGAFIHVVADDIDWDFLYNDSMIIRARQ